MTSRLLLVEGILDVKDPKGSADRKFWKAWRRLWISFSAVCPSGRREPYLLLNSSRSSSSSEPPEKEIKIPRDGLLIFRCRSKSRPYRTWALASRNKLVLYFAAESETAGQNWMQSVRDGLWPPCFPFQMLTASSQEVSLIDDDNTFLSGLLGVYGRLVLTSRDIISLMHPYWGATLLEISLNNVKDVLFVREAEVSSPAGVFSILLKSVEGSKVKALQFFCSTAKDTVQWILSQLYAKCIDESNEAPESKTFDNTVLSKSNKQVNCGNETTSFLNVKSPISSEKTAEADVAPQILQNYRSTVTNNTIENKSLNFIPNIYANVMHATDSADVKPFNFKTDLNETGNEYENIRLLNEKELSKAYAVAPLTNTLDFAVYSTVNKNASKDIKCQFLETQFPMKLPTNKSITTVKTSVETEISSNRLKTNCENTEMNCILSTRGSSNAFPIDNRFEPGTIKSTKVDSISKDNTAFEPNSQIYSTVDKGILKDSDKHVQKVQISFKNSDKDFKNTNMQNSHLLEKFHPSDLDGIKKVKDKMATESSSSIDNIDIMTWIADESNGLDFSEHLYADILDRKGTVYEEIDTSDDESTTYLPPELPTRPENLEIPDSLRLQKLSKSIKQTLKIMEDKDSATKEYHQTKFIKKIKDVNRIMQISPKQEQAIEPYLVKTKW